ncbi:3-aminobutyryl-CoA ammonia lyase [Syntrophomonas erecta]
MKKAMIRLRMGEGDAHYGGGLVNGARMLDLFGDVATELLIMCDGDEGLFLKYDDAEFLAPVYAGDYIEATGWFTEIGNTSRKMEFVAKKVIRPLEGAEAASACEILDEPIIVAKGSGICVVPKKVQRGPQVPREELL